MTARQRPLAPVSPDREDAALRETVALLELVQREEAGLTRLRAAVTELEGACRARSTLADRTDVEVMEARHHLGGRAAKVPVGRCQL